MHKKIIAVLLIGCLGTTSVAADFSAKITEQGIHIEGTNDSESKQVSIAIYDKDNQLLYAGQSECQNEGNFSVFADVPTTEALRIKVGGDGMYSPDMLLSDVQIGKQVLYVSQYAANGDGSRENPYSTLAEAYAAAEDGAIIKLLDRAEWDISQPGGKQVTILGGTLSLLGVEKLDIPLRIEHITVEVEPGQKVNAANITVGEGVAFSSPIFLYAEQAYLHSGVYEMVSGGEIHLYEGIDSIYLTDCAAAIFENNALYNNVGAGCSYLVYCSAGGTAKLKEGQIVLTPDDGRYVCVNDGAYTQTATLEEAGVYRVSFAYDFKLHMAELRNSESGTTVAVDLSAYNRSGDTDKANPILAACVYDAQMNLLGTKIVSVAIGDMRHYELPLGKIESENVTVKLFLWDSLSGMQSLCDMISEVKTERKDQRIYYVSPQGNENGDGSFAAPFQTIQQALSAAEGSALPVTIFLREGRYNITEQMLLGTEHKQITVEPYENEKAVITTGYQIAGSAFSKADDDISNRILNRDAREQLLSVSLEQLGIQNMGEIYEYAKNTDETVMPVLMQDGKRMQLTAYPDTGYLYFEEEVSGGDGINPMQLHLAKNKAERALQWEGNEIYADGYIQTDWTDSRCKVRISENGDDYVVTAQDTSLKITPSAGRRVRFLNVIEELSVPGEWYLDRDKKMLYLYPYPGFSADSIITFNPRQETLDSIFRIQDTAQITFRNIEFANIGTNVFQIENSQQITIEDCHIVDIAGKAVEAKESKEIMIIGNKIHDASSGVIWVSGGDAWKLHKANNYISDNEIYRFSQDARIYQPAVELHGYGTTVRRNKIYDAPHMAIALAGMGITIEYNEIYNVCNETADAGAIYGGQYPHLQENTIRHNYFHDIRNRTGLGFSVNTVYFDDLWGSCDVYSNIFYQVEQGALVGGGRSNQFWNNLFIDCDSAVMIDSRGTKLENYEDHRAYVNLYWSPYRTELWKKEFPKVYSIMEDEPKLPKYNKIYDNVFVNTRREILIGEAATLTERTGNTTLSVEDAGFFDYENHIFSIHEDSAIYQHIPGFIAPDAAGIGIWQTPKPHDTDCLSVGID